MVRCVRKAQHSSIIFLQKTWNCGTAWNLCSTLESLVPQRIQVNRGTVEQIFQKFPRKCVYINYSNKRTHTHILIYAVFSVPQFHTPLKMMLYPLCRNGYSLWNTGSTHVPQVPHYNGCSSGSASSSSSTEGSRRQKHSVGMPLIRFPLVLARPRVSIKFDCFRYEIMAAVEYPASCRMRSKTERMI